MQEKAGVIVKNRHFLYFEYSGNYAKKKTKCVDSLQQGAELIDSTHGRETELALGFAITSCLIFSGYVCVSSKDFTVCLCALVGCASCGGDGLAAGLCGWLSRPSWVSLSPHLLFFWFCFSFHFNFLTYFLRL